MATGGAAVAQSPLLGQISSKSLQTEWGQMGHCHPTYLMGSHRDRTFSPSSVNTA